MWGERVLWRTEDKSATGPLQVSVPVGGREAVPTSGTAFLATCLFPTALCSEGRGVCVGHS